MNKHENLVTLLRINYQKKWLQIKRVFKYYNKKNEW